MDIKKGVFEVIAEQFQLPVEEIKEDLSLRDENGVVMDELDAIELVMALEDKFNLVLDDSEAENWETVSDVLKFVEEKMNP